MLKRVTLLLFVVLLLPAVLLPQSKTVLRPDGTLETLNGAEVQPIKNGSWQYNTDPVPVNSVVRNPNNPQGLFDTLGYSGTTAANFGVFGQDWLIQWFVAPADLTIHKVAVAGYAEQIAGTGVEVKLVRGNWPLEKFQTAGEKRWGYYPAAGNGFTEITAFRNNLERTGEWVPIQSETAEPWGDDLWAENGGGYPITPSFSDADPVYTWVDLSVLELPTVLKGEIFGIAVKNTSSNLGQSGTDARVGFWAYQPAGGFNGWKFYAVYRLAAPPAAPDNGWWSRAYVWDFIAEVEITGDQGPTFNSLTQLVSSVATGPFTIEADITDTNPGNPAQIGVASAVLQYSVDGGTNWTDVAMTGTAPNFTAQIPQLAANQWVSYQVVATDINGNSTTSPVTEFYIFAPSGATTLVIFNGREAVTGYPQDYYWGSAFRGASKTKSFQHDRWSYGAIPDVEFLNNYKNVIEIVTSSPIYNDSLIALWLAGDATRNYFLSSEEFLGDRYAFTDRDFAAGDFEYDVLGVTHVYNDVSYDGTSGQNNATKIIPIEGTEFGGPLFTLWNSFSPKPDSLMYHPFFELGEANWLDVFDVREGVTVDVNAETRGVAGAPSVITKPAMVHHTLTAGNKVAFMSFDPLAINTANSDAFAYYHWVGYTESAPPYQVLEWFGIDVITDVREVGGTPVTFDLAQNYPNPFNPSTTINFSIPRASNVSLKVFDVLGKEIATLLNAEKTAGNYEVTFDASKLPSGVYFYTITTGDFSLTKKMMLMK